MEFLELLDNWTETLHHIIITGLCAATTMLNVVSLAYFVENDFTPSLSILAIQEGNLLPRPAVPNPPH